jgi:hypothetical protein
MAALEDAAQLRTVNSKCWCWCITFAKVRRSANKFRKLQIRKFVCLKSLLDLRTFPKCGTFGICVFVDPIYFCDYMICKRESSASLHINKKFFLITNIAYNAQCMISAFVNFKDGGKIKIILFYSILFYSISN